MSCSGNLPWTTETFTQEMKERNPLIAIIGNYKNNKTKISYVCNKCGKIGEAVPSSLLKGHGCKYCGQKNASITRRKTNEEFIKQLAEKNPGVQPLEKYVSSTTSIRCRCSCGNVWSTTPDHLLSGQKCRRCQPKRTKRKKASHKGLKKSTAQYQTELRTANPTIEALEEYNGTANKILFRCKDCGHEWRGWPHSLLKGQGCPACKKRWKTSFPEQAIYYYVRKLFTDAVNCYRGGFGKSELDIFIPSINIGIEYDGRKWHQDKQQTEIKKYERCRELGITLVRVRESELQGVSSEICDYLIISEYGHKKRFASLDQCLNELMALLEVSCDIDTQRDRFSIMEQYYSTLRDKSLGVLYPEIAKEWYQPKNGTITPFMILPKSNESFWWKCSTCGNIYPALISTRTAGHGCSKCAGVSRKTQNEFVEELKEINPDVEIIGAYINVNTDIEFFCRKCGTYGKCNPRVLLRGGGCRSCGIQKIKKSKTMSQEEFDRRMTEYYPTIDVLGKYINSKGHILCRCRICGYEWSPSANALLSKNTGCSNCSGRKKKRIVCVETGEVFEGINQAERITHISHSTISNCCNGKGTTAGGFHWKFVTEG